MMGVIETSDDGMPDDPDLPDEGADDDVTTDPPFRLHRCNWLTEYHLDWSEYLGPLADFAEPLDWIDQVLIGNETLNQIPLLGDLLQEVVDNYIPDWLSDLAYILMVLFSSSRCSDRCADELHGKWCTSRLGPKIGSAQPS